MQFAPNLANTNNTINLIIHINTKISPTINNVSVLMQLSYTSSMQIQRFFGRRRWNQH